MLLRKGFFVISFYKCLSAVNDNASKKFIPKCIIYQL